MPSIRPSKLDIISTITVDRSSRESGRGEKEVRRTSPGDGRGDERPHLGLSESGDGSDGLASALN